MNLKLLLYYIYRLVLTVQMKKKTIIFCIITILMMPAVWGTKPSPSFKITMDIDGEPSLNNVFTINAELEWNYYQDQERDVHFEIWLPKNAHLIEGENKIDASFKSGEKISLRIIAFFNETGQYNITAGVSDQDRIQFYQYSPRYITVGEDTATVQTYNEMMDARARANSNRPSTLRVRNNYLPLIFLGLSFVCLLALLILHKKK